MDLIEALAGQLGVPGDTAKAVAGAVLGAVRDQVPDDETAKLDEAVPEISEWSTLAKAALERDAPDESGSDGLFGAITGLVGSGAGNELLGAVLGEEAQEAASTVALFEKLGLKTEHAALAAPLVLDFIEDRVGEEWAERIAKGAPMLVSLLKAAQDGDGNGLSLSGLASKLLG